MQRSVTIEPDMRGAFEWSTALSSEGYSQVRQPTLADVARIMMLEHPGLQVYFDESMGSLPVGNVRVALYDLGWEREHGMNSCLAPVAKSG